ncbi:MAG: hypothetical protein LBI31_05720 [Zoogloeaceae bacterium]|jgi:hypothetical protein|nr:hypothetical protein [Zoogloeaceae bacterium]
MNILLSTELYGKGGMYESPANRNREGGKDGEQNALAPKGSADDNVSISAEALRRWVSEMRDAKAGDNESDREEGSGALRGMEVAVGLSDASYDTEDWGETVVYNPSNSPGYVYALEEEIKQLQQELNGLKPAHELRQAALEDKIEQLRQELSELRQVYKFRRAASEENARWA